MYIQEANTKKVTRQTAKDQERQKRLNRITKRT